MAPQNIVGEAWLGVHADTSKVPAEIEKGVGEGVAAGEKAASGASKTFGGLAAAATGALVIGGVAKVMGGFVDAASAVNREGRVTTQILANTGNAANVTRGHIDALARSISLKTGLDQAQIRASENILLGFTSITNAGKGMNAIFDRTIKAAGDISTVMKTDTSGAAKILGKALSDPIKGLTLLRRAGVVLPPTLEAQIKAMGDLTVKTKEVGRGHEKHAEQVKKLGKTISDVNKLHAAQQVLLGAIEGRYKGTAEAAASSGTKLRAQLKDLQITFGQLLLPAIKQINLALSALFGVFNRLPGPVKTVLPALGLLAGALVGVGLVIGPLKTAITNLGPVLDALKSETLLAAGPYILIGIAIIALAVIIVKNWDTIKRVTLGALNAVKDAVLTAFNFLREHFQLIATIVLLPVAPILFLAEVIVRNFDTIQNAIAAAWNFVFGVFDTAVGFIRNHIALIGEIILGLVSFPALAAQQIAQHFNSIVSFIGSIPGRIAGLIGEFFNIGHRIVSAIADGIRAASGAIVDALKGILSHLPGPLKSILSHVPGIGGLFSFQTGGIVPGPLNKPQLIIAHGGERVIPAGQSRNSGQGTTIVFGPQAIVVQFSGVVPTEGQAFRTGQAIADGAASRLATRRAVRTAGRVA